MTVVLAVAAVSIVGCSGGTSGPPGGGGYFVDVGADRCLVGAPSLSEVFPGRQFDAGVPPEVQDTLMGGNEYATPRDGCFFPQRGVPLNDPDEYAGDRVVITRFNDLEADPASANSFRRQAAMVAASGQPGARSGIPIRSAPLGVPAGAGGQGMCLSGDDQLLVTVALAGATPEQVRDGIDTLLADSGCTAVPAS